MVSTRSRSSLHSGDGDGGQQVGQPEVSSAGPTPRRSFRLARGSGTAADTPSGRARAVRAAGKPLNLDVIEEEAHPQAASPPSGLDDTLADEAQQDEAAAAQPAEAQQQGQEEPSGAPYVPQGGAGALASDSQPVSEPIFSDSEAEELGGGSAGESGSESEGEEEGQEAGAGAGEPLLGIDPGLLDRVAREMFALLEGAFGGGEDGSEASSSEEEGEGEEEEEEEEEKEEEERQAEAASNVDGGATAGDIVPRHLRWEPELQLPGMEEGSMGSRQQQQHKRPQQQVPLAKQLHVAPRDERALRRSARGSAPDTAGKQWFDLPATTITDEVKRDLRMLHLRTAFDPKAFFKKQDNSKFPKHFHIGTVVAGAADFYSGRLTKAERKRTFTEEIMSDPHLAEVRRKRFTKMQEEKAYWGNKKAARKTENERLKKKPRKAKH